jgi:tetratricopeptide (TPR) repeat protein
MKPLLILALSITLSASAQQERFLQAQKAYAEGQYQAAIEQYQALLSDGFTQPEINYNLGNAAFKARNLPLAIKHYRRAQYNAPTDPDIQANLRFALEDSGATLPKQTIPQQLAFQLTHSTWLACTALLYTLFILTLFLRLFAPRLKPKTKPLFFLLLTPLLISAYALNTHQNRFHHPEQIVQQPDTPVHFAPLESSTIAFSLPAGTILQPTQIHQQTWIQIRINEQTGWVQRKKLSSI